MKMIMMAVGLAVACTTVLAGVSAMPAAHARALAPGTAPAVAPTATPATRPPASARQRPVAYDCLGWRRGQVKTGAIALSCFGTVVVKIARWRYWTGVSARSTTATLGVDLCRPNCSAGKFRKYPATVTLYRVRSHHGTAYYSRLKLQYRHGGPRTYVYRWAKYPGATIPVWVGGPTGRP
jgi:hypothetical protein